VGNAPT